MVSAMRFDTWVLPLMNVYVLGGYTFTNTSLDATFTIDRIILPKPPIVIETIQESQVGGPYFGVGTTLGSQEKDFKQNADGSYDIYFSPKAPEGQENNWLQTIPGKSWWIVLRMYGPEQAWIDQTYRPSELELVK